jgi:hypothetical protein
MNAPLFVCHTKNTDEIHISLGVRTETLCGLTDIKSSVQLEEQRLQDVIEGSDSCKNCKNIWQSVKDDINVERTVECHRCKNSYSSHLSRTLESMNEGVVPICRPCYKDLLEDDESEVDIDYKDAESFSNNKNIDRTLDVEKILNK